MALALSVSKYSRLLGNSIQGGGGFKPVAGRRSISSERLHKLKLSFAYEEPDCMATIPSCHRIFTAVCFLLLVQPFLLQDPVSAQQEGKNGGTREEARASSGRTGLSDKVPDVRLPDQNGKVIALKDFQGKKVLVVYFYPKDDTTICTAEACSFRDAYEQFKELGAEVIGISSDSVESHKKFAQKNHLSFSLLADTSGMARRAFGVPSSAMVMPGRVTYVVDKEGVVCYMFNSMMDGPKHAAEAMNMVRKLSGSH